MLNQLGFALARLRDPETFGHLQQALAIRREFGDTLGEAQTAIALGEAHLNLDGPEKMPFGTCTAPRNC